MITSTGLLVGAQAHVRAHGADGQATEKERERKRVTAVAGEEECFSDHYNSLLENMSKCPDVRIPSERADLTMDS